MSAIAIAQRRCRQGIGKRVGKEKSDRNNLQLDCSEELHGAGEDRHGGEGQGENFKKKK